jgi:hypothetical protein
VAADADFSLDAAFFLKKTPTRAKRIGRIVKELKVPKGTGSHVLSYAFSSNGSGPPLILHIDESKYEREPVNYYVQMHLHDGEHADRVVSSRGTAWAFGQLSALAKGAKVLFFLEAQMELEENILLPSAVIAPPLTVGGRTLSVIGVEYGAPLEDAGVDGFRWTRLENVTRLKVSYTKTLAVSLLPSLWEQERTVVEGYVREVFPR